MKKRSMIIALLTAASLFVTACGESGNAGTASQPTKTAQASEELGNELAAFLLQAIVSGVYGAVGMGASTVYWIEEWSIVKATVVHFIATISMFLLTSGFLKWSSPANPRR